MQNNVATIPVLRLAGAGAVTLVAIYAICWVALLLPFPSATHAYLGLFTNADPTSGVALVQGLFWSAIFGLLAGALGGLAYNLFGALRRE